MKPTTHIHVKLESKGNPKDTLVIQGTMLDCARQMIQWLAATTMNSYIRITVARNATDLIRYTERGVSQEVDLEDMLADLTALAFTPDED